MGKNLWDVARAVYYMIRKAIPKQRLLMDLRLLLKCSKIAGNSIADLLTFHHHGNHCTYSALSCRSMDPDLAFYSPREVEFSCSNTPAKRKHHRHHHHRTKFDVAKAFEIFNSVRFDDCSEIESWMPTRQLRVTDSPFPIWENDDEEGHVDVAAEEFIRRFYEELRLQLTAATPVMLGRA